MLTGLLEPDKGMCIYFLCVSTYICKSLFLPSFPLNTLSPLPLPLPPSLSLPQHTNLFCLLLPLSLPHTNPFYPLSSPIPPGNAHFYGLSITEDLDTIRNILGVCPQHDVLWGDLTANEHMKLFGHLKGIPVEKMKEEIATLLEEVQLLHVRRTL